MPATEYWEILPDDFSERSQWNTDLTTFDDGSEQRRSRWANDRTIYSFSYPSMVDDQITDLWNFYRARKGSWESFYCAVPPGITFAVTQVSGTSVVLSNAIKPSPSNITTKVNNVELFNCTFDEDEKKVIYPSPQTGDIEVTYYEMKLVRFVNDALDRDWILWLVTSQTLDFITV